MTTSLHGKHAAFLEDFDSAPFATFQGLTPWFDTQPELEAYISDENEPVEGNTAEDRAMAKVAWSGTFEALCQDEAAQAQFVREKFFESIGSELAEKSPSPRMPPQMVEKFSDWLLIEPMKLGEI